MAQSSSAQHQDAASKCRISISLSLPPPPPCCLSPAVSECLFLSRPPSLSPAPPRVLSLIVTSHGLQPAPELTAAAAGECHAPHVIVPLTLARSPAVVVSSEAPKAPAISAPPATAPPVASARTAPSVSTPPAPASFVSAATAIGAAAGFRRRSKLR